MCRVLIVGGSARLGRYMVPATVEDYMAVNTDGVENLPAACQEHAVRAFVYVSSIAVTDHFRDHIEVDEREPLPPIADYRSPYDRSKRLGEDAALAADQRRTAQLRPASRRRAQ